MASSQGVGVVRAQYPQLVGQQFGVRDHGTGRVRRRLLSPGQIPAGDEGVGVVGAEMAVSAVYQVLEVGGGDIDLAAVTEAFAEAVQHAMGVWPVQGAFGVAGEHLDRVVGHSRSPRGGHE